MDCLRGPKGTESTVHYFSILDTYEAINLFKLHLFIDLLFLCCCLTSLLFISIFLVCIFSVFMIILVEINVKGFLCKCAKKTYIYGQIHKVANSERYWTLLTKENLPGLI